MNKIIVFYDIEGYPVFQILVRNVKNILDKIEYLNWLIVLLKKI